MDTYFVKTMSNGDQVVFLKDKNDLIVFCRYDEYEFEGCTCKASGLSCLDGNDLLKQAFRAKENENGHHVVFRPFGESIIVDGIY